MLALYIIGGIAIVIFALMLLSLTLSVEIKETITIKWGLMGIMFGLDFENKSEEQEQKNNHKKKKTNIKQAKTKKTKKKKVVKKKITTQKSILETIEFITTLIKSLLKPSMRLIKHTRVTKLYLAIKVSSENANETAIIFGEISAGVYNFLAHLDNAIKLKIKQVNINPDFVGGEMLYDIKFKVKLRLCHILWAALCMFYNFLVNTIKNNKQETNLQN